MSARVNPFFTPTQISNCSLWLDGADPNANGTLPANGASLRTWVNKGSSAITLSNPSTAPTFRASFQNGLGSVSFSNSYFQAPFSFSLTAKSAFLVCSQFDSSVDSPQGILSFFGSGNDTVNSTNGYGYQASQGGFGSFGWLYNIFESGIGAPSPAAGYYIATGTAGALTPYSIYGNVFSSQVEQTFVNGVGYSNFTITTTPGTATTLQVGARQISGSLRGTFYGTISEIIVFARGITISERQQVEGYLAWKWGLQSSLPATHPYKTSIIPPLLNPPVVPVALVQNTTSTFSPTQISGCQMWLDSADSSTVNLSGSNVTQWNDKSGNGRNAVVNASYFATWTSTASGLSFNTSLYTTSYTADPTNETMFVVFNYTGSSTNTIMLASSNANGRFAGILNYEFGIGKDAVAWGPTVAITRNATQLTTSVITSGTSTSVSVNGRTPVVGGSLTFNSGSTTRIGSASGSPIGFGPITGILYEMIFYNAVLSTSQRQQVEGYLAWKWGIQGSLPASHPYKSAPPFTPAVAFPARSLGQIGTFNPLQISGCTCWLDASDLTSMTASGSTVSQWRDKSLSRAFNGSGTLATANSYACVRFNGSQSMTGATTYAFTEVCTNAANMICFIVLNISSSTGINTIPFSFNFEQPRFTPFYNGSGTVFFDAGNQADPRLFGSFTNNVRQIHVFLRTGITTLQIRINGSQNASNTFTSPANFGNQTYTAYISPVSITGDIHEILYYSNEISLANLQRVEGYLAWKWGLQASLPANHPWKLYPPPPS